MNTSGKMVDVLLIDRGHILTIWADPHMEGIIARTAGVERACALYGSPCHYHAYLDPRYDKQIVMASIKLRIEDKMRRKRNWKKYLLERLAYEIVRVIPARRK